MSPENDVLEASNTFYRALTRMARGDAVSMEDAWVRDDSASAQHPIGGRDRGHDPVIASFAKVAELATEGEVHIVDQVIDVGGDMAVETGVEKGSITLAGKTATLDQRVTNVYRRTDKGWKLQHHHTDLSPSLLGVLKTLERSA